MKKYYRPTSRIFACLSAVMLIIFICGIIMLALNYEHEDAIIGVIILAFLLLVLFLMVSIIEYTNCITISYTQVSFSRNTRTIMNDGIIRRTPYKKLTIAFVDIESVSKRYAHGDKIISNDTIIYVFTLKNGDTFEELLYHYGKKNEKEIIDIIEERVKAVNN